jgi:hypothetical protein
MRFAAIKKMLEISKKTSFSRVSSLQRLQNRVGDISEKSGKNLFFP